MNFVYSLLSVNLLNDWSLWPVKKVISGMCNQPEWLIMLINRIYDGVEAETRKSQASFQII